MKFLQIQIITIWSTKLQPKLLLDPSNPNYLEMFYICISFYNNWQHFDLLTWATCKWQKLHLGPSNQKPKTHNER